MRTSQISDSQHHSVTRLSLGAFVPTQTSYRICLLLVALALPVVALYLANNEKTHQPPKASEVLTSTAKTNNASAESTVTDTQTHASATTPGASASSQTPVTPSPETDNHTSVEINGRHIPVGPDGQVHTTVTDQNSTTSVDVSSSGNSSTSSSTNISVQSSSSTSSD
ncbi:MAG TPA: hypothetical protein VJP80_00115 [Candidatus Saccharimonadales bacterium]|nr:hypothetical protein [Candidatus Saccharimonadales bacterium]